MSLSQLGPDLPPVGAQVAARHNAGCRSFEGYAVRGPGHTLDLRSGLPLPDLCGVTTDGRSEVVDRGLGEGQIVIKSHGGLNSEANAFGLQEAFAVEASATFYGVTTDPIQAHRQARFKALIEDKPYGGNLSALGRALGYKDGVYVRQMRDGIRPITEKTVAKIEALSGRAGWFGISPVGLSPTAIAIGAYFDNASAKERELLARLIPIDIDLSEAPESRYTEKGGLDTGLGPLDVLPPSKNKGQS